MTFRFTGIAMGCVAVVLAMPAAAQEVAAAPAPRPNTISVSGSGESRATPDVAYVTVGVITEGARAQEASQANAAATEKVMAALRQQGIAAKDLQTSNYSVQPRYDNRPNGQNKIVGYQVSNQVRATVHMLDSVGTVIDTALDTGANNVMGVGFGLEKKERAESEALVQAVQDAWRKADTLARATGSRIMGVYEIHEGALARPVPMFEAGVAMARAATPISPGEMTVDAEVQIVYTIQPGPGHAGLGGRIGAGAPDGAVLAQLLVRRATLNENLAGLRTVYKDDHPKIREIKARLTEVEREIDKDR